MKSKFSIDKIYQIVREEVQRSDQNLNSKLQMYIAKLNRLKGKKSQEYLNENRVVNEEKQISELKMIEKVIQDLNNILYKEEEF